MAVNDLLCLQSPTTVCLKTTLTETITKTNNSLYFCMKSLFTVCLFKLHFSLSNLKLILVCNFSTNVQDDWLVAAVDCMLISPNPISKSISSPSPCRTVPVS